MYVQRIRDRDRLKEAYWNADQQGEDRHRLDGIVKQTELYI